MSRILGRLRKWLDDEADDERSAKRLCAPAAEAVVVLFVPELTFAYTLVAPEVLEQIHRTRVLPEEVLQQIWHEIEDPLWLACPPLVVPRDTVLNQS